MAYNRMNAYYLCQYKGVTEVNALVKSEYIDKTLSYTECIVFFADHMHISIADITCNMMAEPELQMFLEAGVPVLIRN